MIRHLYRGSIFRVPWPTCSGVQPCSCSEIQQFEWLIDTENGLTIATNHHFCVTSLIQYDWTSSFIPATILRMRCLIDSPFHSFLFCSRSAQGVSDVTPEIDLREKGHIQHVMRSEKERGKERERERGRRRKRERERDCNLNETTHSHCKRTSPLRTRSPITTKPRKGSGS